MEPLRDPKDVYGGRKDRRKASMGVAPAGDEMLLAVSPVVQELLQPGEIIRCSGLVRKLNKANKIQNRVFMVTSRGIYNLMPDVFKLLRVIGYPAIGSIAVSPHTDEIFIVRVPYEQRGDYVLISPRKTEFVNAIVAEIKSQCKQDVQVDVGDMLPYRLCTGLLRTMEFCLESSSTGPVGGAAPASGSGGSFVSLKPRGKRFVVVALPIDGESSEGEEDEQKRSAQSVVVGVVGAGGGVEPVERSADGDDSDGENGRKISKAPRRGEAPKRPPPLKPPKPPQPPGPRSSTGIPSMRFPRVRVLYNFDATAPEELTIYADDILLVIEKNDDGWWLGVDPEGNEGLFPSNYTKLLA